MAIAIQSTAELIKPLEGAIVARRTAAEAITAGQSVYLDSSGNAALSDADAVASNYPYGVAVETLAQGQSGDFVVFGPISSITGGTPGAIVYTSGTAGGISESTGTKTSIVGVNHSATVLFVRPQIVSLS